MTPSLTLIITLSSLGLILLIFLSILTHHLLQRRTHTSTNNDDTIRLTLNGPRSTEQVEYMKGVRERNLVGAWEEASRSRFSSRIQEEDETETGTETYFDERDTETDLGSINVQSNLNQNAMALHSPARFPAEQFKSQSQRSPSRLLPPQPPWMKQLKASPTMGSSIYSSSTARSSDTTKSKTPTVVEEWESEHGGFSAYFGMKQPVALERWV